MKDKRTMKGCYTSSSVGYTNISYRLGRLDLLLKQSSSSSDQLYINYLKTIDITVEAFLKMNYSLYSL